MRHWACSILTVLQFGALWCQGTPESARDLKMYVKRLSEEADRFAANASRVAGTETLQQTTLFTARMPAGMGKGDASSSTGAPNSSVNTAVAEVVKREVVSAYGFLQLPTGMREVRQVITVDGKKVKTKEKGLDALAMGVTSQDDAEKRKLLESFEKNGLHGVATDFGPLILLFAGGKEQRFEFNFNGVQKAGGQDVAILRFQQMDGPEALTIYENGKPTKQKMHGQIWARPSDGLPFRVVLDSEHEEGRDKVRDLSYVDYTESNAGLLLPAMVMHRQYRNGALAVEDLFRYSDFRLNGNAGGK
jgi:hypothetical protein